MQVTELRLFEPELNVNLPIVDSSKEKLLPFTDNPQKSLEITLNSIFPQHREDTKIQKARRILEETALDITDEQLEIFLIELQYLLNSWLDTFEMNVLNGFTLKQILRGG